MGYVKEKAKIEIEKLVEDFKRNKSRLQNQAEAQIENNFIRPLFKYLNWNTTNEGLAVADYEFIVNRTGRGGKRPDYTLQLDGQHLLVMDAKQVKYDMHDPRWLNQVYSYGYSTQSLSPVRRIDFAVLSDFEEFVVLDCTLHVNDPRALPNSLVLNWTCDDFVNQFDRLWDLFERENMRRTARTRHSDTPRGLWALALSPRKVKANRTPPDKAFLADMDNDQNGWRVRLAKDMKKLNPTADGALITAAVQLLIDRLIFIKALSDREIEDDYLAQLAETVEKDGLAESDSGWFTACRKIFDKLNRFYNGNIFKPRPELEAVTVANKTVYDIISSLQPENSPYNFAVLPVEILGTIYERFLGRVVRTTEQRVKIEEKPEVRKAGGVYYTPQYIVEYIVKNTVGKLLENCQTPADAARLKILDPACGSGSFLVGAYAFLIDWHVKYFDTKKRLSAADRADAYYDSDGRVRLTARLKRQILINNLFGVDIDQQAVEVTRFSLSLKALEDTRREELYEERTLFKETVLPDLNNNIKCGNSLIGPDYFSGKMFSDPKELSRVNPFDWQREFPAIFSSGGFDAVIGNPPYIRIQRIPHNEADYLFKSYKSPTSKTDISLVFIEKGLSISKKRGLVGLICTSQWLATDYGKNLRKMLADGRLQKIIDFGSLPVFENAQTYPAIFILSPTPAKSLSVKKIESKATLNLAGIEGQSFFDIALIDLSDKPWNLSSFDIFAILNREHISYKPLGKLGGAYIGMLTGKDDAFVVDSDLVEQYGLEKRLLYPYAYRGAEIDRYKTVNPGSFLIYPYREGANGSPELITERELQVSYPKIHKYLSSHKEVLRQRMDSRKLYASGNDWYRHLRAGSYNYIKPSKLLIKGVCMNATVGLLGENTTFNGANCPGIILEELGEHSPKYILGLLNSKLVTYYLRAVCPAKLNNYRRLNANNLNTIPLRTINFADPSDKKQHDEVIQLVESMLALNKHKTEAITQTEQGMIQRQIDATDREIDSLVYQLYGLTKEEIAIVEGQ